nr:recombinase family protein [uncultured Sphingomonas sp.]
MTDYRGLRVCIYARVSTSRQAKNDLSIPDQIERLEAWCQQTGATVAHTVIEPGASAIDDDRPRFQKMIAAAMSEERRFDIILVHSLSRLFRNAVHFMQYRAMLKRPKVRIVSITQSFGDDPAAELAIGMLALFDEYTSLENAKHTQRAMLANARLGYWNGQTPPLGYRTYEAERKEGKSKRKLEIDDDEAFVVCKVFELYLHGPPGSPPLGITRLADWMNRHGYKYRGRKFHVSNVQAVLRNTAYCGVAFYNKSDSRRASGAMRASGSRSRCHP